MGTRHSGCAGLFESPIRCLTARLEPSTRLANSVEKRTLFWGDSVSVRQPPLTGACCWHNVPKSHLWGLCYDTNGQQRPGVMARSQTWVGPHTSQIVMVGFRIWVLRIE